MKHIAIFVQDVAKCVVEQQPQYIAFFAVRFGIKQILRDCASQTSLYYMTKFTIQHMDNLWLDRENTDLQSGI